MVIICKKTIDAINDRTARLFTAGASYEFIPIDNRYTRVNNLIGYVKKDDEGYKRWISEDFKKEHFVECN